jgi:hypothetical protein
VNSGLSARRGRCGRRVAALAAAVGSLIGAAHAFAGGGGQNMLLVVNPNDEASLRIANAYIAARNIPERNVVYLAPTTTLPYNIQSVTNAQFNSTYVQQLPAIIQARGLAGQIDYIGTIGGPQTLTGSYILNGTNTSYRYSAHTALAQLTPLARGMPTQDLEFRQSELFQVAPSSTGAPLAYTRGSNKAIHWADQLPISPGETGGTGDATVQWYMAGAVGYAGRYAITPEQVIWGLKRSAAADGTKPAGTVYFVESADSLRTGTRKPYWKSVQDYMTANNIPWQQPVQAFVPTPTNRPDVMGAVVGGANITLPNGSTYLPGSYADNLTSQGGQYVTSAQTKADKFLRAGAAATTGTITEPFAIADRFTQSTFYVYHQEGSTVAESFYKSVARPDFQLLQGDLLSQAYADVPNVTLAGVPASGAVNGTVRLDVAAALANARIATGVAKLELFVDGQSRGTLSAASGSFNLDTTGLTDGRHEVRIVAYNNSQAESQGYAVADLNVNNLGRSVAAAGGSYQAAWNQQLQIPVTGVAGGGAVSRIEMRSYGRVVGQVNGAAGNLPLDATKLAFGDNVLTPVAVFADGSEVRGAPVTVTRDQNKLPGSALTPVGQRIAGIQLDYFSSRAGRTVDLTSFAGTPDYSILASSLTIDPDNATTTSRNIPEAYQGGANGLIAVRATAKFNAATEGEYGFHFDSSNARWEGLRLLIDGVAVLGHEFWNGTAYVDGGLPGGNADTLRNVYLMPGEHDLTLFLINPVADADNRIALSMWWRNPNGDTAQIDSASFYSVVPEPASAGVLLLGASTLLRRRRRA